MLMKMEQMNRRYGISMLVVAKLNW
jgi:hypothetical protein